MSMIKQGMALLLRRRDFRLLMIAQFAAQAGDGLVQAALAKVIVFGGQKGFDLDAARSPDELLRIVLYIFVPYTLLSPFLGVVIDRWDRRRVLAAANGGRAVVIGLVAVAGATALADTVVFLAFLLTLASTRVVLATKAAAIPATLDGPHLVEANAVSQLGGALFQLGGGAAAFVAARWLDAGPVVLAGAGVYAVGTLAAVRMGSAGEVRGATTVARELRRLLNSIAGGLREVARTPKAGAAITTYFWLRLLWSFSIVGISFTARRLLGEDNFAILLLTGGAGACGAVLGFVAARSLNDRVRSSAHLVLSASLLAGAAVAALGGLQLEASIAVLALFLGFGFFLGKISLDTMVQEALGDDFRGRAFSLYDIAYNLAWVVAAGVMKLLWTRGAEGALIAGMGVVFLAGVAALAVWFKNAGLLAPAETG